jgi:hypothetical protein
MFNRRRIALVVAGACLLLASGASAAGEALDAFTAAATPSHVKRATSASYTITLTNDSSSPDRGQRAKIGIPSGFVVDPVTIHATSEVLGDCEESTWEPDGELIADSKIQLKRPGGNDTGLCQEAKLTVTFDAISPQADGTYPWTTQLFTEPSEFTLIPPEPTVVVDGTDPEVTITGPGQLSNNRSPSFTFTVNEAATLTCKLDGDTVQPCTSPRPFDSLSDGSHTFAVQATDAVGNTGEASYTWTIDATAPAAAISEKPSNPSNSRAASFTFTASEPSSFECQLDGGSFQACGSPASYQGLGDGTHTFAVRPTDAAGNTGAASSHGWRIDGTAPETTIGSGPRSGTTALSGTFTFSASEPAAFECKLDSAAFAPCTSPKSHAGLSRREHTFAVRAIDAAGNPDPTPAIHRWTIAAAPRRAATTSALLAPRAGARVTSPPLLVWRRAARASYYNVQLYRGRVKMLSSWPVRTRLQLRARWTYLGRQRQLAPGAYRWYVWPGYGRPSARRYGRLLGQSTFTVTPRR